MKKNGFTITEVAVTAVIVVLIGIAIASTCLISANNSNKTKTLQFAINEIYNVQEIFTSSVIENSGEVDYTNLKDNILEYYGDKATCILEENKCTLTLFLDNNYTINATNISSSPLNIATEDIIDGAVEALLSYNKNGSSKVKNVASCSTTYAEKNK